MEKVSGEEGERKTEKVNGEKGEKVNGEEGERKREKVSEKEGEREREEMRKKEGEVKKKWKVNMWGEKVGWGGGGCHGEATRMRKQERRKERGAWKHT